MFLLNGNLLTIEHIMFLSYCNFLFFSFKRVKWVVSSYPVIFCVMFVFRLIKWWVIMDPFRVDRQPILPPLIGRFVFGAYVPRASHFFPCEEPPPACLIEIKLIVYEA
jgi:hypothetical protein